MQNCEIYRATTFQILPIPRSTNHLSAQQLDDEQSFIHLLESHLKQNNFYFSYTYNITLSMQKQGQHSPPKNDWKQVKNNGFDNFLLKSTRLMLDSFGINI
jgi:hypothetical protein